MDVPYTVYRESKAGLFVCFVCLFVCYVCFFFLLLLLLLFLGNPKRWLTNSADPEKNAASDQGLHCLYIVKPFSSGNN